MKLFQALLVAEQVAEQLKTELERGSYSNILPGVSTFVEELKGNHKTVKAALKILETEGVLINQGRGLKRQIVTSKIGLLSVMCERKFLEQLENCGIETSSYKIEYLRFARSAQKCSRGSYTIFTVILD